MVIAFFLIECFLAKAPSCYRRKILATVVLHCRMATDNRQARMPLVDSISDTPCSYADWPNWFNSTNKASKACFKIDANCIVNVSAEVMSTGNKTSIRIREILEEKKNKSTRTDQDKGDTWIDNLIRKILRTKSNHQ
ncbi:putative heat shock protein 70 family, peptide-binding domain protein [Tanacetum coccineum]